MKIIKEDPDGVLRPNAKDEFDTMALFGNHDSKTFSLFSNNFYIYSDNPDVTHGHLYSFLSQILSYEKNHYSNPPKNLDLYLKTIGKMNDEDKEKFKKIRIKDRTPLLEGVPYVIQGRIWTKKKIISFWNEIAYISLRKKDILDFMEKLNQNPIQYKFEVKNKLYNYEEFVAGNYSNTTNFDPSKLHTMNPEEKAATLKNLGARPKTPLPLSFKFQTTQENLNFKNLKTFKDWIVYKEWNSKYIQDAKEWLLELDATASFNEFDSQEEYINYINELSPEQIKNAIDQHYDGGWKQFIKDAR